MTKNTLKLIEEYLWQGGFHPGVDAEALEAEATLVRMAPSLLELLERARNHLESSNYAGEEDELIEQINEAIAEAEGE